MFKQLDTVRTTKALLEHGLAVGAFGCVLEVATGPVYLVEFCNGNGETLAMLELKPADLVAAPQVGAKA
ncbi:MAG TPA: DUF4926 domain-containing protein [Ramlibacter sp.]|nr:DUF4926 domain-containing protein [Ramlibacter sp.]